jgi:hypothetical protein
MTSKIKIKKNTVAASEREGKGDLVNEQTMTSKKEKSYLNTLVERG